jgi:phytoene dehydrogenase-like protein
VLQSPPLKNFYLIGDNQFPGQGIAAVVSGARTLASHLEKIL